MNPLAVVALHASAKPPFRGAGSAAVEGDATVAKQNGLDATVTVLANGCYRCLAARLRGYSKAAPKHVYRRFVATGDVVEIDADKLVVHFDKRNHNPVLREAALDRDCPPVRWIGNLPIVFRYP